MRMCVRVGMTDRSLILFINAERSERRALEDALRRRRKGLCCLVFTLPKAATATALVSFPYAFVYSSFSDFGFQFFIIPPLSPTDTPHHIPRVSRIALSSFFF